LDYKKLSVPARSLAASLKSGSVHPHFDSTQPTAYLVAP
jgi:hypothetical protein